MIGQTFIEDLRTELKAYIQDLFTYDPGGGDVQEFKIINEFSDVPETYPCIIMDVGVGSSIPRHVGTRDVDIVHFDFIILTAKPTIYGHIVTCEDGKVRSGRSLAEYGAVKLARGMTRYVPSFSFLNDDIDLELNLDMEERDGIFKSAVMYEISK